MLVFTCSISTVWAQNISSKTFYRFDEQKAEMIPDQELRWYYDANDQDTINEGWIWEEELNSFQLSFRRRTTYGSSGERLVESTSFWERSGIRITQKEWEYDNTGRNISFSEYRKNASEMEIRGFSRWEKSYNSQGCLDAQTYFQGGTIWRPLRRTRYFYRDNCQVDSTLDESFSEEDWQATGRSLFLYQDTVISTTASLWQNESWVFNRKLTARYDAQGYLLESKILYPDSSQFRQENRYDALGNQSYYAESLLAANDSIWEYFLAEAKTYDPQNRVLTQSNLFDYSRALQQFMSRNERTRFYDEKGRIIAENSLLIDLNLADSLVSETLFSFEYEEYCDGLLRGEEAFREAASPKERISRIEYGYENAAVCEEEAIGLTIAPNPVSDELSFYAEALMEANTQISIYDMQQRLVQAERVPYRTMHYIVPVQALTAGYYYLRVGAAERSLYAKFVKLP
ncbi:MAG: T9SS type A sorting domain-containing protein [Bacteroidia bacterium]